MKRAFSIVLFMAFFVLRMNAQDQCPQPRVNVNTELGIISDHSSPKHYYNSLVNFVENAILSQNSKDIRFSTLGNDDVDYYLTVIIEPIMTSGVKLGIKLVDCKKRIVLNHSSVVEDPLWFENMSTIAPKVAKEVSPLYNKIKDHQHLIRNTTNAAISSKFEIEKRSYEVNIKEKKKVTFVLKDCDGEILPNRSVILELDGKGEIDKTLCTVDENGKGEFVFTADKEAGEKATVHLLHTFENVAGRENQLSDDHIDFNIIGKLWLLVNYETESAKIYVVGEHLGQLEMDWDSFNTRGGVFAAFSSDEDKEIWSTYLVGFLDMSIKQAGNNIWTISKSSFPESTKITSKKDEGYEIKILWPLEGGGSFTVTGTITYKKPALFNEVRKKYLAAKRGL